MKVIKYRLIFVQVVFLITISFFIGRLAYMQIYKHHFYQTKAEMQLQKIILLTPKRGIIYDRNGTPLAMTAPAYSVYAIPPQIKNKRLFSQQIAPIVRRPWTAIYRDINVQSPFVWIKRKADVPAQQKLAALKLDGLNFIKEEKRVYPRAGIASHVLGFVGIDNQGLGGIEYEYDHLLTGSPGKIIVEGDPRGYRIVSGTRKIDPSYDGGHIFLTIDEYIQYVTEKHLKEGVQKTGAQSGQAIVMDPQTGEILAMASYPAFDPNHWTKFTSGELRNRCISDLYEPGSVFKVITVAAAIQERMFNHDTVLSVPKSIMISKRTIREAHGREPGETDARTVSEIIEKSLNVGTSILSMKLGKEKFQHYIRAFGFGSSTDIELPGEAAGIIRSVKHTTVLDNAMNSFGQGISTTPLQIAVSVAAVANGGVYIQPRIVKYTTDYNNLTLQARPLVKKTIISTKTANEITEILHKVVEQGTGIVTKIPGYTIAGKTGTAQKTIGSGGYISGKYIASFVGYFPIDKPRAVILITVDSPSTTIWGSTVAAPIFKNITTDLIRYWDMAPLNPSANLTAPKPTDGSRPRD